MAATISYTFSEIPGFAVGFQFDHESLHHYQKRASQRLTTILEGLDLGAPANLGFIRVTWLPDHIARVRYLVMEGILAPIITVKIEFQEGFLVPEIPLTQVEIEEEEEVGAPYLWVGIASINHSLGGGNDDNPQCGFFGSPIEGRLVGYEPFFDVGPKGNERFGFQNSCGSFEGYIFAGQTWINNATVAYGDDFVGQVVNYRVNDGQDYEFDQFLIDEGCFSDQGWQLTNDGIVDATKSGMIATEHMDTLVTAPEEAYEGNIQPGYWRRSIIVDINGHVFPEGEFSQTIAVVDGRGFASNSATYEGGVIPCSVLAGHYEISAFAETFSCECCTAQLHIRLVIGRGPGSTVVDIFPDGLGSPADNARNIDFERNSSTGGYPGVEGLCQSDIQNFWGDNEMGVGWWPQSIFVNVAAGTFSIKSGTRRFPHYGAACASTPVFGPDYSGCIGCIGEDTESPSGNLDGGIFPNRINYTGTSGGEFARDGRMGVIWHLARVMQISNTTGYVCRIRIVGNDGGNGGGCAATGCQSWAYGTNIMATGIASNIPFGTNIFELPDLGRVPFTVGELVVIVGFTDTHFQFCAISGGDWRAIVQRPDGAGQDFTHISWWELRCPLFPAPESFFDGLIEAMKTQVGCTQGGGGGSSLARQIECDCNSGQFSCDNK